MQRPQAESIVERLRALIARGQTQRAAARELAVHPGHVSRLVRKHALPHRAWRLSPTERARIRRLINRGRTPREIATQVERSRRTIELIRAVLAARPVEKGAIVFRDQVQICERHGRVSVWPCVTCAALAAAQHLRGTPARP